jgi:hypothetical protein
LLKLLNALIYSREPLAPVEVINSWQLDKDSTERFQAHNNTETYLLFDNGEDTYLDGPLWNAFFKNITMTKYYVVLFCSHGSPSDSPVITDSQVVAPLVLLQAARMSLWPSAQSAGVLLTRTEFDEVVERFPKKICLHPILQQEIFEWTNGHIGAITELLEKIAQQVCCFLP